MHTSNERRTLPRADAAIKIENLDGGAWMVAHDLSLKGMLVTTSEPKWPGQHVRVRFTVPGEPRAIRATCRVVDLVEAPRGVGLSLTFLALHPDAQLALHRYIDRRPAPDATEAPSEQARSWVRRMVEDCAELTALARTPPRRGHLHLVR